MSLRTRLGFAPKPEPADWVRTGATRWLVVKRRDNVVREALQFEEIDLNTGQRVWSPVIEYGQHHVVGLPEKPTTRVRTLTEQELAAE